MKKPLFYSMMLILLLLGGWQSFRWIYKTDLMMEIKRKEHLYPIAINDLNEAEERKYSRTTLRGRFINNKPIYYYSLRDNIPGYEILTPFKLTQFGYILVNRGWHKEKLKLPNMDKTIIIAGHITDLPRKHLLNFKNDLKHNMWFDLYYEDLTKYSGINITPLIVMLDTEKYLVGKKIKFGAIHVVNNHLGYALMWFSLAIVFVFIYRSTTKTKDQ